MASVLQAWVMELPLREQGTLLSAVRGCDVAPKEWEAGIVKDTAERRLTAWIRWAFMVPHDAREVDEPGAFMQSSLPYPLKASGLGHYPMHWYSHVMHALEVIGYRHPHQDTRERAKGAYNKMVSGLHLHAEGSVEMEIRLGEDRIATGQVVS